MNDLHNKLLQVLHTSPDIVKKSTVNQLEEYIEQIKVYIPNTGLDSLQQNKRIRLD